jgi:branched-chain amino acid transport system permease protein
MNKHRTTIYWTGFCVIVALLIVAPLVLPEFWRRFVTEILIWGLLAMSSDVLIGYVGMVSFGHSAFFGLGMYGAAAALLTMRPPNLWVAIIYGLVGSGAVALFVAYFSTRLRDIYFAITTLIFSQIFYVIIFTWTEVTGGENGLSFRRPELSIPGLFSVPFTSETLHWFVLAVVTASYLILRRITQSPFGMVLQSIRENEPRTRAIGYPVERYKMVAVMLSGLFAGLSGVLYARLRLLSGVGRGGHLQRHGRHRHAGGTDRGRRLLPAAARGVLALLHRVLPDPRGRDLRRHGDLHAAGPARFRAALAEQIKR